MERHEDSVGRKFSHVGDEGSARMVDVGGKAPQRRIARASGTIHLSASTVELVRRNQVEKGDVLGVSRIAGIQAAKQTAGLIPLCHPLLPDWVDVEMNLHSGGVTAVSEVRCIGRTGVEMEALTAVAVALLAVYDMCKAVDSEMHIGEIRLIEKVKQDVE